MSSSAQRVLMVVLNGFTNDSRVLKESVTLHNNGYYVRIVALHEEGLKESEKICDIDVHRVALKSRRLPKKKIVQIFKYFEYLFRVVKRYHDTDIVHCNDLVTLPIGVLIKRFFRKDIRVLYDAHEYETEINGLRPIEKKLRRWLEKNLLRYADMIITVSSSIADEYQRLYSIARPAVVLNCPAFQNVQKQNIFREKFGIGKDQVIFLYQGGLNLGRGIELLLDAFLQVETDNRIIIFMGYGQLVDQVRRVSEASANIYYHEAVPPDILLNYTASADYGILFYQNTCLNHYYCLPNKIFEYLMAGIPVLGADLYEIRRLIETEKIGVVAAANDVPGILVGIDKLLSLDYEEVQGNVRRIKAQFNWEEQEKVLLNVYKKI